MVRAGAIAVLFAAALWPFADDHLPELTSPLQGITSKELRDNYAEEHNGHRHEAIDIMTPRGTPVHAVVSGTIRKLFLSKPGGNTIYQFDDRELYCFYYAHLDGYAAGIKEGAHVAAGEIIAFTGSTGNADPKAPHLHFAIFRLTSGKEWWKGDPVNPYPGLVEAVRRP